MANHRNMTPRERDENRLHDLALREQDMAERARERELEHEDEVLHERMETFRQDEEREADAIAERETEDDE